MTYAVEINDGQPIHFQQVAPKRPAPPSRKQNNPKHLAELRVRTEIRICDLFWASVQIRAESKMGHSIVAGRLARPNEPAA
jgi:hypothetical protein